MVVTLKIEPAAPASFADAVTIQINGLFCQVLKTSVSGQFLSVLFVPPEWDVEVASGRVPPSIKKSDFTGPSVLEVAHTRLQATIARSNTLLVMYDSDVVSRETVVSPGAAPSGYMCKPKIRIVMPQSMYTREYAVSTLCQFTFEGDAAWRSAGVIDKQGTPPFDLPPIVQRSAMICLGFDGLPSDKYVAVTLRISIDQIFLINLRKQFVRIGLNNLSFAFPQAGSVEGGTSITILGSGFLPYMTNLNSPLCKFSVTPVKGYTTAGRFISDSSMICVSPSGRAPYPGLQLAPFPLEEVSTSMAVSLDGSGSFCLEPCQTVLLGQMTCNDAAPQRFTYTHPSASTFVIQWVHCSQVVNGCPRPFGIEKLGYIGCFFRSGIDVSMLDSFAAFSKYVCIRAMPSSAGKLVVMFIYAANIVLSAHKLNSLLQDVHVSDVC